MHKLPYKVTMATPEPVHRDFPVSLQTSSREKEVTREQKATTADIFKYGSLPLLLDSSEGGQC